MPRMTARLSPVQMVLFDQLGFAINFGTIPYKTQEGGVYVKTLYRIPVWNRTERSSLEHY